MVKMPNDNLLILIVLSKEQMEDDGIDPIYSFKINEILWSNKNCINHP